MGQAIISKLKVQVSKTKDDNFLHEKFKKYFNNKLAKAFFEKKELNNIIENIGIYVKADNYEPGFFE